MRTLFVTLRVKPAHRESLLATLDSHIGEILAEESGLRSFDVLLDAIDPAIVYLYEVWDDVAAIDRHRGGPVQTRYFSRVRDWMERGGVCEGDIAARLER